MTKKEFHNLRFGDRISCLGRVTGWVDATQINSEGDTLKIHVQWDDWGTTERLRDVIEVTDSIEQIEKLPEVVSADCYNYSNDLPKLSWGGYLSIEEGEKLGERIDQLYRLHTEVEGKIKTLACWFIIVGAAFLSVSLVLLLRNT